MSSDEFLRANEQLDRARTALRAAIRFHVHGTRAQNRVLNLVTPVISAADIRGLMMRQSLLDNVVEAARKVLAAWTGGTESGDLIQSDWARLGSALERLDAATADHERSLAP